MNTEIEEVDQSGDAEQLRQIASDIEAYFSKWVTRCRRTIENGRSATSTDATLSSTLERFEEKRIKWEAQRQRDLDSIAEKSRQLSDAWLQLESEQRRFLQMKETWKRRRGNSSVMTSIEPENDSPPVSQTLADTQAAAEALVATAVSATETIDTNQPPSAPRLSAPLHPMGGASPVSRASGPQRILAIRQFEQLRREVDSSQRSRHPRTG